MYSRVLTYLSLVDRNTVSSIVYSLLFFRTFDCPSLQSLKSP